MGKVKGFAKEHWDDIATIGIVAAAETALCLIYRAYLKRCENKMFS